MGDEITKERRSLTKTITGFATGAVLVTAVAACSFIYLVEGREAHLELERELNSIASLYSHMAAEPLREGDYPAGQAILQTIQSRPDLIVAAILDRDDLPIAQVGRPGATVANWMRTHRDEAVLTASQPVLNARNETLGRVIVVASLVGRDARFLTHEAWLLALLLTIVAGTALAARALAHRMAAQLRSVGARAENLSFDDLLEAPFEPDGFAELGALTDALNRGAGRIANDCVTRQTLEAEVEKATEELQKAKTGLEQAVQQRTVELQEKNIELERGSRMKDEFLANMSHELRTPLNAVLGMSEAMLEKLYGPVTAKQDKCLKMIHKSGHHLLELINEILDLAKIEAGRVEAEPKVLEITRVCEASVAFVQELARKNGLSVDCEIECKGAVLWADERHVKQVLLNLLSNAVKFTPKGKRIGVHARSMPDQMEITVWDEGVGIPEDQVDAVFEAFHQVDDGLDKRHEGTGLGLALVQQLVALNGGSIRLESTVGRGSRFIVTFPLSAHSFAPRSTASHPVGASRSAVRHADLRVLIAEDNEASLDTLKTYLEARGMTVFAALDGLDALEQAATHLPQIILMDVQLPKIDGLEATRQLRAHKETAHIPIVALTALAMRGDEERCRAAGADEYLSKPVSLRALIKTIDGLTHAKAETPARRAG